MEILEYRRGSWRGHFLWLSSCMSLIVHHKARLPELSSSPYQQPPSSIAHAAAHRNKDRARLSILPRLGKQLRFATIESPQSGAHQRRVKKFISSKRKLSIPRSACRYARFCSAIAVTHVHTAYAQMHAHWHPRTYTHPHDRVT